MPGSVTSARWLAPASSTTGQPRSRASVAARDEGVAREQQIAAGAAIPAGRRRHAGLDERARQRRHLLLQRGAQACLGDQPAQAFLAEPGRPRR